MKRVKTQAHSLFMEQATNQGDMRPNTHQAFMTTPNEKNTKALIKKKKNTKAKAETHDEDPTPLTRVRPRR